MDLELGGIERLLALEAKFAQEGLTFDDVLLLPADRTCCRTMSRRVPLHARGRAEHPDRLGRHGHRDRGGMAIALARMGGLGWSTELPIEDQAAEVDKVKARSRG